MDASLADCKPTALLLSVQDAGAVLGGLSRASVDRLRSAGKLPPTCRLGGRVFFRAADLESFVACGCDISRWRAEAGRTNP
jgi:predicted DNA-binding transcriptional regulator AlpA